MQRAALLIGLLAAVGCAPQTWARFEPYASTSRAPAILVVAQRAYQGDAPSLFAAGGDVLGTVYVRGNGYADTDAIMAAAAAAAAQVGGTHYIVSARGAETEDVAITQPTATTTISESTAYTTYHPATTIPITRYSVAVIVVRVPESGWIGLPPSLRPRGWQPPTVPAAVSATPVATPLPQAMQATVISDPGF